MWRHIALLVTTAVLAANASAEPQYGFRLEPSYNSLQGQEVLIDLTCYTFPQERVTFLYFQVAYDLEILNFAGLDSTGFGNDCQLITNAQFTQVIDGPDGRRYGVASVYFSGGNPGGPSLLSCAFEDGSTESFTLARLRFLLTDDRTYQCDTTPLYFIWTHCGANSLIDSNSDWHMSAALIDPLTGLDIHNPSPLPSFTGAFDSCLTVFGPTALRDIVYENGYVHIVCPDSFDWRGDVNCNGLQCEIADYIFFTQYFISGADAFSSPCSDSASDVNADGLNSQIDDLMRLYNVIHNKCALYECTSGTPIQAVLDYSSGVLTVTGASPSMAHIVVDGQIVPELLVTDTLMGMGFEYDPDGDSTSILIEPALYLDLSTDPAPLFTGAFVDLKGAAIRSVSMVTSDERLVTGSPTDVGNPGDDPLPRTFQLDDCYPNPFNPSTSINFGVPTACFVRLTIHNSNGQKVRTLLSEDKKAGSYTVEWNGKDDDRQSVASGIYFFRLDAGAFSATKKMVLLK